MILPLLLSSWVDVGAAKRGAQGGEQVWEGWWQGCRDELIFEQDEIDMFVKDLGEIQFGLG